MKKEALENINSSLFSAFNPEDELWVIGGQTGTISSTLTLAGGGASDNDADYDWSDWSELEGPAR